MKWNAINKVLLFILIFSPSATFSETGSELNKVKDLDKGVTENRLASNKVRDSSSTSEVMVTEEKLKAFKAENDAITRSMINEGLALQERTISAWININFLLASILTILMVAIPLLTYFFAYKPARKGKKKIDRFFKGIDKKIEISLKQYLDESHITKSIDSAKNLTSANGIEKQRAMEYLSVTIYNDPNEKLLDTLYKNLSIYDMPAKFVAIRILFGKESAYGDGALFKLLDCDDEALSNFMYSIAEYISISGGNNLDKLAERILNSRVPLQLTMGLFNQNSSTSREAIIKILGNKTIKESLDDNMRLNLLNNINRILEKLNINPCGYLLFSDLKECQNK